MVGRQGLRRKDVERRPADSPLPQGGNQCLVDDDGPPGDIDDQRAGLHQADPACIDQAARFRRQRAAEHEDVALRDQRVDVEEGGTRKIVRLAAAVDRDLEAEAVRRDRMDLSADRAVADDADTPAGQLVGALGMRPPGEPA